MPRTPIKLISQVTGRYGTRHLVAGEPVFLTSAGEAKGLVALKRARYPTKEDEAPKRGPGRPQSEDEGTRLAQHRRSELIDMALERGFEVPEDEYLTKSRLIEMLVAAK